MDRRNDRRSLSVARTWALAGWYSLFVLVGESACYWPWPQRFGTAAFVLMCVTRLATVVMCLTALFAIPYFWATMLWFRRVPGEAARRFSKSMAWLCLLGWVVFAFEIVLSIRHAALAQAARRGNEIVRALERHRGEHGRYPERLEDLAPEYLNALPGTGMIGYPTFEYIPPEDRSLADAFELWVRTPSGPMNWDRYQYVPTEGDESVTDPRQRWRYIYE